jgi:hypothetical protein
MGSQRSLSGTASPVPAAKTETPARASHAGVPASRGEAPAAAETRSDRRQSRGKKGARDAEADTRRGHGVRGAEVWSWAYDSESESEMAVAMETAERRRVSYGCLSVRTSVLLAGGSREVSHRNWKRPSGRGCARRGAISSFGFLHDNG